MRGKSGRRDSWRICLAFAVLLVMVSGCQRSAEEWAAEGEAAVKANHLDEAESAYQKALAIEPALPEALYGLGWVYASRRDLAAARIYYERCLKVAPDFYGGYKGMGSVHMSMGFVRQAEASFKRAIELKPDEAASYGSLGYTYLISKRLGKAEEAFRHALELEPHRGELHYLMAELRTRQGAYDEALEELNRGENKPFEEVKFRQLDQELRGRLYLRKALEQMPDDRRSLSSEEVARRLAFLDRSEKAFDKALSMASPEEKVRLYRLRKKVYLARERIAGPPPP